MIKLDGNAMIILVVGVLCITLLEVVNMIVLHHNGTMLMITMSAITGLIGGALGYKIKPSASPPPHLK